MTGQPPKWFVLNPGQDGRLPRTDGDAVDENLGFGEIRQRCDGEIASPDRTAPRDWPTGQVRGAGVKQQSDDGITPRNWSTAGVSQFGA